MSKRVRVKNFSEEEKTILIDFVKNHKTILESKSSEPRINKKKKELWEKLSNEMVIGGFSDRDANTFRSAYYRLKQQAKSVVGTYKRNLKTTGGGPGPSTQPSELDWAIADICPVDFEEDTPILDCDDNSPKNILDEGENLNYDGLIDSSTGVIIVSSENLPQAESLLNDLPKPSIQSELTTSKCKKRKMIPMTETQSKMVSLHERQINQKIERSNDLINLEMQLVKTKLTNEEAIHALQIKEMNLKIENELKTKILNDLKIQKIKLEIEKIHK